MATTKRAHATALHLAAARAAAGAYDPGTATGHNWAHNCSVWIVDGGLRAGWTLRRGDGYRFLESGPDAYDSGVYYCAACAETIVRNHAGDAAQRIVHVDCEVRYAGYHVTPGGAVAFTPVRCDGCHVTLPN